MKTRLPLICLLVGLAASSQSSRAAAPAGDGVLTWNNGDTLAGQLVGMRDGLLLWSSPRFGDPQHIDVDYIEAIEFPHQADESVASESFRVQLSTGDVLFGQLTALDTQTLTLDSKRFGLVTLRREFVRELRQLQHTQVIYDGPRWLDSWRVLKAGRRLSEWRSSEHGHLHTTKYGGEIFHDLPELEVAEINLGLTWTGKPGFQIDFSAPTDLVSSRPKPKLSIKSWGNDVVAQSSLNAADFQHLLKLNERQKELRLRIVWDNPAGQIVISGDAGRELSRVLIDKSSSPGFGVMVKNRSDDLTLEQIRVSKWNGTAHSKDRQPGKSYLRLANGDLLVGSVAAMQDARLRIAETEELVDLEQLAVAEFLPDGRATPQPAHLRFQDGAELSGRLLRIEAGKAEIESPIAEERLTVSLDDLESLRFFQGKTSEYDFHLHFDDGKRLSGTLAPVGDSSKLGWQSVGSRTAVSIADRSATIERRMGQQLDDGTRWGNEIVYFHDGSMVTGKIASIEQGQLELHTPYSEPAAIPLDDTIRAVEIIQVAGRVSFASDDWEFLRDERPIQRSQERIEVSQPVSFRDLDLYHGGKLSFNCSWDRDFVGLITIYLGTSPKLPRGGVARLTISRDHVTARCLLKPAATHALPPITDRRATVSLATEGKQLSVWINGVLAIDTELRSEIAHKGIWMQCGSAKGPLSRSTTGQVASSRLIIDRLRVGDSANRVGARFASSGQLQMLLNLPRNRREDAPDSILCSTNGDLLRGHLVDIVGDAVKYRSRYEQVTLPRTDVAAVVWLQPLPDDEKTDTESESSNALPMQVTLVDGSTYLFHDVQLASPRLIGQHHSLGACRIPVDRILKLEMGKQQRVTADTALLHWQLTPTPEPIFVDAEGGGLDSPYIGFDVEQVVIPMLDGSRRKLGDDRGKVVVLDFWATWSAPCLRSLPKLVALTKSFPPGTVELLAVNQEEAPFTINTFLASRNLEMAVGLDPQLKIADQFGVDTIPHTVIIGPNGRVERVFVGTPTGLHEEIGQAIVDLLPPTD